LRSVPRRHGMPNPIATVSLAASIAPNAIRR
jgi:hypothetical protein